MTVKLKKDIPLYYQEKYDTKNLSLDKNKIYIVLDMSMQYYRVISEDGEPVLFPNILFDIIDNSINENWVVDNYARLDEKNHSFSQSAIYLTPKELDRYFYIRFFDKEKESINTFLSYITKYNIQVAIRFEYCPDYCKEYYKKLLNKINKNSAERSFLRYTAPSCVMHISL